MIFFSHVIFALSDEAIKFDYSFGEGRESQLEGNFNDKVKEDLKRDFNLLTGDKKEKCDKSVKSFQGVWVSGGNNIDSKLGKIPKKKKTEFIFIIGITVGLTYNLHKLKPQMTVGLSSDDYDFYSNSNSKQILKEKLNKRISNTKFKINKIMNNLLLIQKQTL